MNLSFLKKIAPWVGAAATGNVPALIAMAANTVGEALGSKVKADPEAIQAAVAGATPEQLVALKKAELDFQTNMAALGFENKESLEQIAAADRASARSREVAVKDWMPRYLGLGVVTLALIGEGFLLVHGAPAGTDGVILGRILGTLDAAMMLVLSYYFGSSSGSDRKTELLAAAPAIEK